MNIRFKQWVLIGLVCTAVATFVACGGDGGGGDGSVDLYSGKTTQATITTASVQETLASMTEIVPSCTATGVATARAAAITQSAAATLKVVKRGLQPLLVKRSVQKSALLPTTPPASTTGDCGGSVAFPTWNHSDGNTSITIVFSNYCTLDTVSGNKTLLNGSLSVLDDGTPSDLGPITTKVTASIPSLSVIEKDAANTILASATLALSGFEYTPAIGATADISNLTGNMKLTSFEAIDNLTLETYKVENLDVTVTKNGTDTEVDLAVRLYRSTSGYSDITTFTPLVMDANQNLKSGTILFAGANNTNATLTVVEGVGQNFTIAVNGTPLTGATLNCEGL